MAITYPLSTPTSIGIESIQLRAVNAVSTSQSPFSYKQQVVRHSGQIWEATVTVASSRRDLSAPWKAFLTALRGQFGTFLLGDPDYATPQGTAGSPFGDTDVLLLSNGDRLLLESGDGILLEGEETDVLITGSVGDESVSITMDGNLKAGDYIQLGSGSSARLHQVLEDQTGSGTLEIWPGLRDNYTDVQVITDNPKGVFRLKNSVVSWNINSQSAYGITFEAVENLA